jgi:hypothetical protein
MQKRSSVAPDGSPAQARPNRSGPVQILYGWTHRIGAERIPVVIESVSLSVLIQLQRPCPCVTETQNKPDQHGNIPRGPQEQK